MSLPLPLPQTHTHPKPLQTLAPFLLPHLPHSLPLLRRIEHRLSSPSACTLATFPPSTSTSTPPPSSFSALWIDRTRAPETECWLFSTYELPSSPHTLHDEAQAKAQILALFHAVAESPPPNPRRPNNDLVILGTLNECLLPLLAGSDLERLIPEKVLTRGVDEAKAGATHTQPVNGKHDERTEGKRQGILSALSTPYMKWIIPPPSPSPSSSPSTSTEEGIRNEEDERKTALPPSYHFDKARPERGDCRLAISRSEIPRTEETLSELGSVGIRYLPPPSSSSNTTFPPRASASPTSSISSSSNEDTDADTHDPGDGELISWSFLSPDGSLSSLHVEPAHRGLGLAKAVSGRLFWQLGQDAEGMGFRRVEPLAVAGKWGDDWDEGVGVVRDEAWAHSDVAVDNLGSAGVVRGVGGREGWIVRWVGVDLGRVRGVVGGCKARGV